MPGTSYTIPMENALGKRSTIMRALRRHGVVRAVDIGNEDRGLVKPLNLKGLLCSRLQVQLGHVLELELLSHFE